MKLSKCMSLTLWRYLSLMVGIKATAASFIKRLRDEEGYKVQLVVANHDANHEAVINVSKWRGLSRWYKINARAMYSLGRWSKVLAQA